MSEKAIERIFTPATMQERAQRARAAGQRIAFVPTMGYLHDGHLSLLAEGRRRGELLVLSIFVNPMQFGPREDLSRYPRDLEGDLKKAASVGCDVAFCPDAGAMYPPGFQTRVEITRVTEGLCGARRPGHFTGVATVVLKLLNCVSPHVLLLGEKDYQQLLTVRRLVRDLDLPIEVVGCPLYRDSDGLAMSSRNAYLSPAERKQALVLSRALFKSRDAYAGGERGRQALLAIARAELDAEPGLRLDYLELRAAETLDELPEALTEPAALLVAGFIGSTRLIDNVLLS